MLCRYGLSLSFWCLPAHSLTLSSAPATLFCTHRQNLEGGITCHPRWLLLASTWVWPKGGSVGWQPIGPVSKPSLGAL